MSHLESTTPQIDSQFDIHLKSLHDCQTDSGFLSGSNIASSNNVIIEDQHQQQQQQHHGNTTHKELKETEADYQNKSTTHVTDSGIDISEQFSSLNLASGVGLTATLPLGGDVVAPSAAPQETVVVVPPHKINTVPSPEEVAFLREVFKSDEDGDTQLHVAVMGGFVEVVWNITRILPHQAFLDLQNNTGRTALHLAVAAGDCEIARHILVCGGSPVARDCRGNTPLHVACCIGDMKMVTELTRPVTEPEVAVSRLNYPPKHIAGLLAADLSNYDGQTCIHLAALYGYMEILQHLTWYGADINAKEAKCGRTALHYAVEARDLNLVTFLSHSCRAALCVETYAGLTPYQLALANDAPAIATLLVELGAQGEPLPPRFTADDDVDYDDAEADSSWNGMVDDILIGGVPLKSAVPVSTAAGPLHCDFYA